jgi:hypothetical protein
MSRLAGLLRQKHEQTRCLCLVFCLQNSQTVKNAHGNKRTLQRFPAHTLIVLAIPFDDRDASLRRVGECRCLPEQSCINHRTGKISHGFAFDEKTVFDLKVACFESSNFQSQMRGSPKLIDDTACVFAVVGNDVAFTLMIINHISW